MNNYEKLREIRNERLLDGMMVLEFGCEVIATSDITSHKRLRGNGGVAKKESVQKGDILSFVMKNTKADVVVLNHSDNCFIPTIDVFRQDYKFLGKPVSLSDVLYLIEMKYEDYEEFKTHSTSRIPEIHQILDMWMFGEEGKDQNAETLEDIYKLLK